MKRGPATLALLTLAACGDVSAQQAPGAPPRPKLVVLISIDQFRADYLTRFQDLFLPPRADGKAEGKPGGFRFLTEEGAWCTDAHHDHYPTYTGPGHAVLLTGAPPAVSGVVGNQWFDRAWKRVRYCAEGASGTATVQGSISPETLGVTTLGDELETATGGRAKTWSFGLKDRAAVLMAGRLADGAFWFDDDAGVWQTSAAYRGDENAPEWMKAWNQARIPDDAFGGTWEFSAGAAALARLWVPPGDARPEGFSMKLDAGKPVSKGGEGQSAKAYYRTWARTPWANDWVLRTALRCVESEGLGQDDVPDLLTVNLSTNDYVGHAYGPDSAQVLDLAVRTDRMLAEFLAGLAAKVPGGLANCVLVLTADHGVAPNPSRAARSGLAAGVQPNDDGVGVSPQRDAAERALDAAFGPDDWVLSHVEHQLYLSRDAYARHAAVPAERIEDVAAAACERFDGMHACFTRTKILEGRVADTPIARMVTRGFHRRVSGDVILVADPFWSPVGSREGATHGSVFPYDAKVPVVFSGWGVRPGRVRERVSTLDIAPTLAELAGVSPPNGSQGRIVGAALR